MGQYQFESCSFHFAISGVRSLLELLFLSGQLYNWLLTEK